MSDMYKEQNSLPAQTLVESVLDVQWASPKTGYCFCPGEEQHSDRKHVQNVLVQFSDLDGVPFVFCFHESCRQKQAQANAELRALFSAHGLVEKRSKIRNDKAREERRKYLRRASWLASRRVLPALVKEPVPLDEWVQSSPFQVEHLTPDEQTRSFLSGLYPQSVPSRVTPEGLYLEKEHFVWMGELFETGEGHEWNFKSVQDWLARGSWSGQQVSKCTFKDGPYRTVENIKSRLFMTLESDTLTPAQFGAIIRYAQGYSKLRAIVHTGGKSIHGSFDWCYSDELYAVMEGLGCDRTMLRYSLTTRLPGVERRDKTGQPSGKLQKLLYLDPVYT